MNSIRTNTFKSQAFEFYKVLYWMQAVIFNFETRCFEVLDFAHLLFKGYPGMKGIPK